MRDVRTVPVDDRCDPNTISRSSVAMMEYREYRPRG